MRRSSHRYVTSSVSRRRHPALPPPVSVPWLTAAGAVWLLAAAVHRAPEPLEPSGFEGEAVLRTDVVDGRYGPWAVVDTGMGTLLLELTDALHLSAGDTVAVSGTVRGDPGRIASHPYRARLKARSVSKISTSRSPPLAVGSAVRSHVIERLLPLDDGRALLAGFLIGDVSGLRPDDVESMRRSGLAHFVAVSGSNVALVLALVWIAAGPLSMGPRRRALLGLMAIPIYAAATRFEPSVMRASVMAGIALGGRLVGWVLEAWQLLAVSIIVLVSIDSGLTSSVGFQMSVAATAGVLVGARWPVRGGRLWRALAITLGAQVAVAPLLLAHFGSVPLMSPLANLVAGPLVAASTVVGAVGVVGPGLFIDLSTLLADAVLGIARGASAWPQVKGAQLVGLALATALVLRWPKLRSAAIVVASAAVAISLLVPDADLPVNGVVVLDVGQGDAILIHSEGRFALVDGGPDELILGDRLRTYGVRHLDLVVLSHVHADHVTGLTGIVGRVGIGVVWAANEPHETEASTAFLEVVAAYGIPVDRPQVGRSVILGSLTLTVEAPLRRYSSPNDQSLVVTVTGSERSMLLSGDIETVAQAELAHLRADVLKVPHQGAATSDRGWLESVGADTAVISVGPNQFGHPADWVIDVLEQSGATVIRTDETGDVAIPLG